ncbi:MAG: hypothetical protein JWO43_603, partial [Candidatus Adlerbacteria bacterium]|nr:hypothetical protein [Candidatus Adlerbacteria bacterium]
MNIQKGFISIGLLIAIILGVAVVGGGSYYVMQKMSAPQSDIAALSQGDSPTATPTTQEKTTNGTNSVGPSASFKVSTLVGTTQTLSISGNCANVPGALDIRIVSGKTTLATNRLPDDAVYIDYTHHGGTLGATCNSTSGTFSTRDSNPQLQPGIYTVGLYTYTTVSSSEGPQPQNVKLLASGTLTVTKAVTFKTYSNH